MAQASDTTTKGAVAAGVQPTAEGALPPLFSDFDRDRNLGALLRLAYGIVRRHIDVSLAEKGFTDLSSPHVTVLYALTAGPQRPIDLARRCRMSRQALDYIAGTMETAGYVRRTPAPAGNGRRLVALTDRGVAAANVSIDAYHQWEADLKKRCGGAAVRQVRDVLAEMVDAFEQPPAGRTTVARRRS
jgi:DNA-binding MarR family transcriptional regulator